MQNLSIISFFWRHIKPYKGLYAVMLSAPLISCFYPFAYNYAIKLLLDIMSSPTPLTYQSLGFPVILIILAQIMLNVIWRISNIAEWKAEPLVRRSLVLKSYDYVQHHSYLFFQDNFTGSISSKLKGILDGYDKFWAEMHHGLSLRILTTFVNIGALCLINIHVGSIVFIWAVILVTVMYKFSHKLNKFSFEETESRHALIGQISDKLTNIVSLFSFASRARELDALNRQVSDDFTPKQVRVYKYVFKNQVVMGVFFLCMFGFILFYMLHLRMQGSISIGDFAFVLSTYLVVSEDIWSATISMQDFSRAMGDLKSALSILNIPQQNLDSKDAKPLVVRNPAIEFRKVHFGYGDKNPVLKKLDLFIQAGEKVGLVGHSGTGKTSLINLLLGYFKQNEGEIRIDNQNINNVTQDSLRENIAVIPQDTMLFHRSLLENIRYGNPQATDEDVIEASKKAHIHDFIMSLPQQYQSEVGERGTKLSGGQRQRIAIARAILKDALILILDEATSSQDSQTEKHIQDSLNKLIKEKGRTVIAIAHRLSTLKHMDRVIVMDKGRIVEEGTHKELMHNEQSLYKKLWELQEI